MRRLMLGFQVGFNGLRFMFKNPKSMLSILVFWIILAVFGGIGVLLFQLAGDPDNLLAGPTLLLFVIGTPMAFVLAGAISSLVLLEMIQQHEITGTIVFWDALSCTIRKDLPKLVPILLVWSAMVWLITIIQIIISAFWMGFLSLFGLRADAPISLTDRGANVLIKGVRIFMQFTLPAVAWERLSTTKSIKKSWDIIRTAWAEILGAIIFGNVMLVVVIAPLIVLYYLYIGDAINEAWVMTTLFVLGAFAYSVGRLLQQIYVAQIYLWFTSWEKELEQAAAQGRFIPPLRDFPRPSLLDDVNDMVVS